MNSLGLKLAALAGALALGACAMEERAAPANGDAARAAEAVANPNRSETDRADDALRKPANVLAFAGIEPGDHVFEMEAGLGYYTELLSYMVGPDGLVVLQNPESFQGFVGEAIATRVPGRLENVRITTSNFDALDAGDASMDVVTWLLGPHDLYYEPAGASLGNDEKAFAEIMRILKPGGTFVILDHAATPGSPKSTGGTIHRIDPAIVRQLAEGAGFVMTGESDVLRNPDDDYQTNVFDPAVRRKTDQFLYKYKTPE